MDYDYSLLPPKCPNCRAMPVDAETPKWMYREYGECYCEEEAVDIELLKFTLRVALFATTNPETKAAEMEKATAMAARLTEEEVSVIIADIKADAWRSHLEIPWQTSQIYN